MKNFYFSDSGCLPTQNNDHTTARSQTQLHKYQKAIAKKLQTRAHLGKVEARLIDEIWRKMLIQVGKFPLPIQ